MQTHSCKWGIIEQGFSYRDSMAENFFQNQIGSTAGWAGLFMAILWQYARSEIGFLCKSSTEALMPVAVKSRKRTREKSLTLTRDIPLRYP